MVPMKTRRRSPHFIRTLFWVLTALLAASCTSGSRGEPVATMVSVPEGIAREATGGDWKEAARSKNVQCTIDDIDASGLAGDYSEDVPRGTWTEVRADRGQRCGDDFETLMFRLANCERVQRKLAPLQCDLRLVWVARAHSKDMKDKNYFDHVGPDGQDPFTRMKARGLSFNRAAENIALTPNMAFAHRGWMDSPGHRKNILTPEITHGALGIVRSEQGYYLTGLFMTP
ncbi:MAG: hypothetical protein H0U74_21060 [Bradymonadaceae bacterium]|nr:hypothetical protein [Lujinxingiaceae bacterium]